MTEAPSPGKLCTGRCGQIKALDQFATDSRRSRPRPRCRDCMNADAADRATEVRDAVFAHYGRICACPGCGITERLTIDHTNGGGTEHRRNLGIDGSHGFYAWLIREGFPQGYQAMCVWCNRSKGEGAVCCLDHSLPVGYQRCTGPAHVGDRVLPLDRFHRDASKLSGRYPRCRDCANAADRARSLGL